MSDNELKNYEAIVLSSGSMKGFILMGFLDTLYSHPSFKNKIKYFAGCSSGAIISYLLSIGYTPVEILIYTSTHDIQLIMSSINIFNFPTHFGAIHVELLRKYLFDMSIAKLGYVPSFYDIYTKLGNVFMCNAYRITGEKENRRTYFSYKTHPDMDAATAVILSCAIPFVFTKAMYDEALYIDGAFFDMCPLNKLHEMFQIDGNILCLAYEDQVEQIDKIDTIYDYAKVLFNITTDLFKYTNFIKLKNIDTVYIETLNIKSLEMSIDKKTRIDLFIKGGKIAKKYYNIQQDYDVRRNSQKTGYEIETTQTQENSQKIKNE
jgi:predicted acylesterase/phospholipase RssA